MGVSPAGVLAAPSMVPAASPGQPASPPAAAADPALDDPLAVARAWITARWSYHASDPAGWSAAMIVPSLSTPAFAARAQPLPSDLARAQKAGESCTVVVTSAAVDPEAPNTADIEYVAVAFTTKQIYTGPGSGDADARVWSLRLTRTPPMTSPAERAAVWLVDAVVIGT